MDNDQLGTKEYEALKVTDIVNRRAQGAILERKKDRR
jgi:hypothetical protein